MTEIKRDKLGRRIPVFDRKAAARKAQKTREEKDDGTWIKQFHSAGGKQRTRGNFGYLLDTDPEKLKEIASEAGKKSGELRKSDARTRATRPIHRD